MLILSLVHYSEVFQLKSPRKNRTWWLKFTDNINNKIQIGTKFSISSSSILMTLHYTKKCFFKDIFCKCDHIRRKLRIWSHLRKEFLMKYFIFCAVTRVRPFAWILKLKQYDFWTSNWNVNACFWKIVLSSYISQRTVFLSCMNQKAANSIKKRSWRGLGT